MGLIKIFFAVAITFATTTTASASWEDIANQAQKQEADRIDDLSARRRSEIKDIAGTPNSRLWSSFVKIFDQSEQAARGACVPIISVQPTASLFTYTGHGGSVAARATMAARKEMEIPIHEYMQGKLTPLQLMLRWKMVQVAADEEKYDQEKNSHAASAVGSAVGRAFGASGGGGAPAPQAGQHMMDKAAGNIEGGVIALIQQQNGMLNNMYPGSSFSCLNLDGKIAFGGGSEMVTYRQGEAWQYRGNINGVIVVITRTKGTSAYLVELSVGESGKEPLSAIYILSQPGSGNKDLAAAAVVDFYRVAKEADISAREKYGVKTSNEILSREGLLPEAELYAKLESSLKRKLQADMESTPVLLAAQSAALCAEVESMLAMYKEEKGGQRRRDAAAIVISVRLDSGNQSKWVGKDGEVNLNRLVENINSKYAPYRDNIDIHEYLTNILLSPDARKSLLLGS